MNKIPAKIPSPKAARKAAGLRQVDVASKAGVSMSTVVRAELTGKYPRSIAVKNAYMNALGVGSQAVAS